VSIRKLGTMLASGPLGERKQVCSVPDTWASAILSKLHPPLGHSTFTAQGQASEGFFGEAREVNSSHTLNLCPKSDSKSHFRL